MGTGPIGTDRFEHLKRGLEVRFQSVVWSKDGTNRPVQVYARRFTSTAGDYIQWIEHDLSSQMKLDQLRRDLSAMAYHDMRGPLGNVYTSLEALKPLLADHPTPQVNSLLDIASRSERQVRNMIDSLLDVQYLEEGSKLLSRTNTPIQDLITSAVEMVQPLAEEKGIKIRFALADDLPLLYIDDDMIERVLLNLLDNAIKYTPNQGVITVSTATSGSEVYVRIRDTGPGIAPEAQAAIFNKFSRIKQDNMPHGVGLGLAFCKLAVEAHGGRIWVHSDEQRGSTFIFALPVEAPATQELPILGQTST
jgi:signal transduction histidine kinase